MLWKTSFAETWLRVRGSDAVYPSTCVVFCTTQLCLVKRMHFVYLMLHDVDVHYGRNRYMPVGAVM